MHLLSVLYQLIFLCSEVLLSVELQNSVCRILAKPLTFVSRFGLGHLPFTSMNVNVIFLSQML